MEKLQSRRKIWAWALYDWANSSFATIMLTFVFGAYFTKMVAPDEVTGAAWWSYALAGSGLILAVLGPICGIFADQGGGRLKRFTALSMGVCLAGTLAAGWLAVPQATPLVMLLVLLSLAIANVGFELSIVFNNALLPHVASAEKLGRVSSLAWGLGYLGGLASLVLVLFGLIGLGEIPPWVELPRGEGEFIRAGAVVVGIWYLIFSLPLFLLVPDRVAGEVRTLSPGEILRLVWKSLQRIFTDARWRNFMIGSAIYRDALTTLFSMGGIYAASRYNLTTSEILLFGIGINVTAGIGCLAASFLEDKVGSLVMVRFCLLALVLCGLAVLWAPGRTEFYVTALGLGLFVGPVQSASRTLVARLSPPGQIAENYGLYALSGRAVSFMGPLCFGLATTLSGNQLAGMATIIGFWLAGWLMIRTLEER